MLVHSANASSILTSEGQVVSQITITIDEETISVLPVFVVAFRMGYTTRHINLLCDTGKLIAFKIVGHWFVSERSVAAYPHRDGNERQLSLPYM